MIVLLKSLSETRYLIRSPSMLNYDIVVTV